MRLFAVAFGPLLAALGLNSAHAGDAWLTTVKDAGPVRASLGEVMIAAQPTPEDIAAMAQKGVTTIVNTRSQAEIDAEDPALAQAAADAGIAYVTVPVGGADGFQPQAVDALETALASASGKVLMHCGSGMRSAHLLAAREAKAGRFTAADLKRSGWPGGLDKSKLKALGASLE